MGRRQEAGGYVDKLDLVNFPQTNGWISSGGDNECVQRLRYRGSGKEKMDGWVYLWLVFCSTVESKSQKGKGV